jgi:hypothetical protein
MLIWSYKFYGLLCLWAALAFDPTAQQRPLPAQQRETLLQTSSVAQT